MPDYLAWGRKNLKIVRINAPVRGKMEPLVEPLVGVDFELK